MLHGKIVSALFTKNDRRALHVSQYMHHQLNYTKPKVNKNAFNSHLSVAMFNEQILVANSTRAVLQ